MWSKKTARPPITDRDTIDEVQAKVGDRAPEFTVPRIVGKGRGGRKHLHPGDDDAVILLAHDLKRRDRTIREIERRGVEPAEA